MSIPRFRFTIRQLIELVAICAVIFALLRDGSPAVDRGDRVRPLLALWSAGPGEPRVF